MKTSLNVVVAMALFSMLGCSQEPSGRWEATQKVAILSKKGDPQTVAFTLEEGEVCALGSDWHYEKELRYKEVLCSKGRGWVTTGAAFKKLSD